jgi:hypothetical protein
MTTSMTRCGPVDRSSTPPSRAAATWQQMRPCSIDRSTTGGAECSGRGLVTYGRVPTHASVRTLGAEGGHGGHPGPSSSLHPARGMTVAGRARGRATLGARWGGGEGALAVTLRPTDGVSAVSRRWLHGRSGERASTVRRVWAQAGGGASDGESQGKRKVVAPLRDLLGEKVRESTHVTPASAPPPRGLRYLCLFPLMGSTTEMYRVVSEYSSQLSHGRACDDVGESYLFAVRAEPTVGGTGTCVLLMDGPTGARAAQVQRRRAPRDLPAVRGWVQPRKVAQRGGDGQRQERAMAVLPRHVRLDRVCVYARLLSPCL